MKLGKKVFGTRQEFFLGIALMIGLLLPHTSTTFLLINPLLCFFFIFTRKKGSFCREGWAPIAVIALSMLVNMSGAATGKSLLTAASIVLCIISFPMVDNVRLKNIYLYLCFGFIFISQVGYMFQLGIITSFIDTAYPIGWGADFINAANENVRIDNISEFRLGGLYRNPNHCAKYVSFIMATYIVLNKEKPIIYQTLFLLLCFTCIILTGSRTGFVVGTILLLIAFLKNRRYPSLMRIGMSMGVLVLLLYFVLSGGAGRAAKIEDGFHGSADLKWKLLIDYLLSEDSIIKFLIGHFDFSLFNPSFYVTFSFDAEYGYMIYCFGFIGLFAFIYYLYKIYCQIETEDRLFFFVTLWMLTSSIFFAYRAVFVYMLLLSIFYKGPKVTANRNKQMLIHKFRSFIK